MDQFIKKYFKKNFGLFKPAVILYDLCIDNTVLCNVCNILWQWFLLSDFYKAMLTCICKM